MKTLKKLLAGILTATILSTTVNASAFDLDVPTPSLGDAFRFTPLREGLQYEHRRPGLNYPSFNNFIFTNPLEELSFTNEVIGDERVFLSSKTCENNQACPLNTGFSNESIIDEENDLVKFRLFFHNNADDPFDGSNNNIEFAKDVKIGIDLSNLAFNPETNTVTPRGFIYARNNRYYSTNPRNPQPANLIRQEGWYKPDIVPQDQNNILRTASDTTQVKFSENLKNAKLEIIPDSIQVKVNDNPLTSFRSGEKKTLTVIADNGSPNVPNDDVRVPLDITAKSENNILWIEMNELVGCFEYSGWVYFTARVEIPEEEPICRNLDVTLGSRQAIAGTNKEGYEIITSGLDIDNLEENAANLRLQFDSTNRNGEFYLTNAFNPNQNPRRLGTDRVQTGVINFGKVLYVGQPGDRITVNVVDTQGNRIDGNCEGSVEIPPICEDLTLRAIKWEIDGEIVSILATSFRFDPPGVQPGDARIKWTTTDPSEQFFTNAQDFKNNQNALAEVPSERQGIATVYSSLANRILIYTGTDDIITAQIVPNKYDPDHVCIASITLQPPEEEEPICTELVVNHNNPIIEGHVSRFQARAFDQNGNPYEGGGIRFRVDSSDYGVFLNEAPAGVPANPAFYFNNFRARQLGNVIANVETNWVQQVMRQLANPNIPDYTRDLNLPARNNNNNNNQNGGRQVPQTGNGDFQFDFPTPSQAVDRPTYRPTDTYNNQRSWLEGVFAQTQGNGKAIFEIQNDFGTDLNINQNPGAQRLPAEADRNPDFNTPIRVPAQEEVPGFQRFNYGYNSVINSLQNVSDFNQNATNQAVQDIRNSLVNSQNVRINPTLGASGQENIEIDRSQAFGEVDLVAAQANPFASRSVNVLPNIGPEYVQIVLDQIRAANPGIFFYAFEDSDGEEVVHVEQLDEEGNVIPECSQSFPIVGLVCDKLNIQIQDKNKNDIVPGVDLEPNNVYTIRANADFVVEDFEELGKLRNPDSRIKYQIDGRYGVFVSTVASDQIAAVISDENPFANVEAVRAFLTAEGLNADANIVGTEFTGANPSRVNLVTFSAEGLEDIRNFLTIETIDEGSVVAEPACKTTIGFDVPPVEIEPICIETKLIANPYNQPDTFLETLDPNGLYKLGAFSEFQDGEPEENTLSYTIPEAYGAFLDLPEAQFDETIDAVNAVIADPARELNRAQLNAIVTAAGLNPADVIKTTHVAEAREGVFTVIYQNIPEARATVKVTQNGEFPGVQNCNAEIPITPPQEPPVCIELKQEIVNMVSGEFANQLRRGEIYKVGARPEFENVDAEDQKVRYQIDSQVGVFIDTTQYEVNDAVIFALRALRTSDELTIEVLRRLFPADVLKTDITVPSGHTLVFVTFSNIENPNPTALQINAVADGLQFNNPACDIDVPLVIDELICVNLDLNTATGQPFNPAQNITPFTITATQFPSDENIIVRAQGPCLLAKTLNGPRSNNIFFTPAEVAAANGDALSFLAICENYNPQTNRVEISADGGANCRDQIVVEPRPEQQLECIDLDITRPASPWEIEEGQNDENFVIRVVTNPGGRADQFFYHWRVDGARGPEWTNGRTEISAQGDLSQRLVNLNRLEPGDDVRVEVWATRTENGARIPACQDFIRGEVEPEEDRERSEIHKVVYPGFKINRADDIINIGSTEDVVTYMAIFEPGTDVKAVEITEESIRNGLIRGTLGGRLVFLDMAILVDYNNRNDEIIYKTAGYRFDDHDKRFDDNSNRECNGTNRVCVEDPQNIAANFKNREPVQIKNINTDVQRIIVKYRMKNESFINERNCTELPATSGCGEKFDNEIEFTSYTSNNFDRDNIEERGNDQAQVVVLCPYLLSRQGGDVLFHDIINVGIDIATCSPIKGGTGVGTKVIPIPRQVTPSTGTDTALTLPSHDICRFSNSDQGVTGYSDALKNFSSSICETEATIAETLYETNINKAIEANISRIARWNSNAGDKSIRNMNDLYALTQNNGVYVFDGNLTIEEMTLDSSVEPAAKTFIVRGGDLKINGNIHYAPNANFSNPKSLPSVAFIVVDGDIIIDENATHLDGIYMALNITKKGEVKSTGPSDKPLKISGSLIGNVLNLFQNRTAVGDPRYDQGSVTVQYDERILLNTPPGLSDLLDIQQAIVP